MADYDVSPSDVQEAAAFLQAFLTARLPDADLTQGSPYYEHLVVGHAAVFALLRRQIRTARDLQSVLRLNALPASESVDDAADALLANLLLFRTQGLFSRAPVVAYLSARVDVLVPTTARFYKTQALAYLPDAASDVFFAASALRAELGTDGRTMRWATPPFHVVAARAGAEYDQPVGPFASFTRFSPQLVAVENVADFSGGAPAQSTSDLIQSAPDALALRALLNSRSNAVLLRTLFPTAVEAVTTVGAGDPEMVRDLVDGLAPGLTLHVGGAMDVFVRGPVVQAVEAHEVGAEADRADGRAVGFLYSAPGVDLTTGAGVAARVVPGDVLNVTHGLPEAPFQFRVRAVEPQRVEVSPRVPFASVTDDLADAAAVTFSIGDNFPAFDSHVAATTSDLVRTSRKYRRANAVLLGGGPVYRVAKVEVAGSIPADLAPYRDAVSGRLVFTRRANALPLAPPALGAELTFTVETLNPAEAQSARALTLVALGWPGVSLDGLVAEVTFDTAAGFAAVDAFVAAAANRPGAASTLLRAPHPVYVYASVPYRLAGEVDESAAARALGLFVGRYRGAVVLDQSRLATEARALVGAEATIFPFVVRYELLAPDGRVYAYETEDEVTLFPTGATAARLADPTSVGLPATGYHAALRRRLLAMGVSDRVARYVAAPGALALVRRA